MVELKILFMANGDLDGVNAVRDNFYQNYPEFAYNMEESHTYDGKTKDFQLLWTGNFTENELSESDMEGFCRLTHHAEGLYEDTNVEYVHVEVCVNGTWFGRKI